MSSIMPAFADFPAEAEIIGRLLAEYTNLEVGLMNCVQVVRLDFDAVLKTMFRARVRAFDRAGLPRDHPAARP
jgi:hypothetical protein